MNNQLGDRSVKIGLGTLILGLACVLAVPTVGFGDEPPVFQKLGEDVRA